MANFRSIHQLYFVLLAAVSWSNLAVSQPTQPIHNEVRISVLTCAPGDEIYSIFGHSAIHVFDPIMQHDWVYDYGIFDYDTPNFSTKFIRGKLKYTAGLWDYQQFLHSFLEEDRQVVEQTLSLDSTQTKAMLDYLAWNRLPENRYYLYDFFYDNCATRINVAVEEATDIDFARDIPKAQKSMRAYLHDFNYVQPWLQLGMDLILGMPADHIPNGFQRTYLPYELRSVLNEVNNHNRPLVIHQEVVSDGRVHLQPKMPIWVPRVVLWVIALGLAFLTFLQCRGRLAANASAWIDGILFTVMGLAGVLFTFMWLGTDHEVCWKNLNLLWLNPLWLLWAWTIVKKPRSWQFLAIYLIFILGIWLLLPQGMPNAALGILVAAIIRSAYRAGVICK